jgi:hypothetical protein
MYTMFAAHTHDYNTRNNVLECDMHIISVGLSDFPALRTHSFLTLQLLVFRLQSSVHTCVDVDDDARNRSPSIPPYATSFCVDF